MLERRSASGGRSRPATSAAGPRSDAEFVVGRQPVFDRCLDVWGFELLFRRVGGDRPDGDAMTADVLLRAGLDFGLDRLVGSKNALVNASRAYLVGEQDVLLPTGQTVIEILEDVDHDAEVVRGCRRLLDEGFTLALDDYVWQGDDELLEMVSLVKLDILAIAPDQLSEQVKRCSAFGARLIAEKVETHRQLETCQELGFDLFQGYLLSRPDAVPGRSLTPNRLNCLRLVEQLCDPDTTARDVQRIIEADPALTLRFLRAAGVGAAGGLGRPVRSIAEGAVLLGNRRIKSWATLMLLADAGDVIPDQLCIAVTRGRLCELMAGVVAPDLADAAMTVGLLSALDLLLAAPLTEILASLALADEVVHALLGHKGPLGAILADVLDWELGRTPILRSGASAADMRAMCAQAVRWADELCAALVAGPPDRRS
ncbi:MAG TPA: EAL domain-containing protein [Acidimicrobiales bacterium]|nr:EAL domain-containing protein [Acidimicrobiales bacterium]